MLNICSELFESWNENKISYCHWKSNEHLKEGLMGETDLDVYVIPNHKQSVEILLSKLNFIKFTPQKGARYPMVDEWIGFDFQTGKLVHIHLHYQIITGTKYVKEYIFPLDQLLISKRILDNATQVYIASPEVEIIILYSRIVLKAKDKKNIIVDADYINEIEYLKKRINDAELSKMCKGITEVDSDKLYGEIKKKNIESVNWYELYIIINKWLLRFKKHNNLSAKIRHNYFYVRNLKNYILNNKMNLRCIKQKTLPHKGISICFVGADGCGKSTLCRDVQKWLNWKIEASRFYLGSGDHYNSILKKLLALAKKRSVQYKKKSNLENPKQKGNDQHIPHNTKQSTKTRILKYCYNMLESYYLKQIAARSFHEIKVSVKYMNKGAIALYDRFPQIQFEGMYDGPKISSRCFGCKSSFVKLMSKLEFNALKKAQNYQPTLLFKLNLSPEESVRRKPDHTIEEVSPKSKITSKLVFDKSTVVDIDASQSYQDELLQIKRYIWEEIIKNNDYRI